MDKTCWSCGHFIIGGMCFKNGAEDIRRVENDYSCDDWLPEDTKGTITYAISKQVEESMRSTIKTKLGGTTK